MSNLESSNLHLLRICVIKGIFYCGRLKKYFFGLYLDPYSPRNVAPKVFGENLKLAELERF